MSFYVTLLGHEQLVLIICTMNKYKWRLNRREFLDFIKIFMSILGKSRKTNGNLRWLLWWINT